jgi:hypothetical protein
MKKNIGTEDRIIRLILGIIAFVLAYFLNNEIIKILCVIFGVFCVFQAIFSWCALNSLLGKNTCPISK